MSGSADILRAVADAFNARDFSNADQHLEFVDVPAGVTTTGRDAFIGYAQLDRARSPT